MDSDGKPSDGIGSGRFPRRSGGLRSLASTLPVEENDPSEGEIIPPPPNRPCKVYGGHVQLLHGMIKPEGFDGWSDWEKRNWVIDHPLEVDEEPTGDFRP